jgi:hypothetical protein
MPDITGLTDDEFNELPLVIKGESKEVRYFGQGLVVIKFLPTIYSFTENRCAKVPGSDKIRLRVSKIFVEVLRDSGIRHAYRQVTDDFILADLIMPHPVEFKKYDLPAFAPPDLTVKEIEDLPQAPPIEVIAKRHFTGNTKHAYVGMVGQKVRRSHPFYAGMALEADGSLPEMQIRFDWRNPLRVIGKGKKIADQILLGLNGDFAEVTSRIVDYFDRVPDAVLPPQLADYFIDIKEAQRTAFRTALAMEEFLAKKDIVFYDVCMFISECGRIVYGEISPDCGRYRHLDHGSLDKDEWRAGGSSERVLKKWEMLYNLISGGET